MKIYELKALLRWQGYIACRTRGSHSVWKHPGRPTGRIVISGTNGKDAPAYLVKQVRQGYQPRSAFLAHQGRPKHP